MAAPRICSVDGCDKAVKGHGLCGAHYVRLRRHGSPTGGTTGWGEAERWLREKITTAGEACIIWPFGRTIHGYGVMRQKGRLVGAHRLSCAIAHGEPPTPDHEAAHSCGNGHLGCINPNHLRWDTRTGNFADKVLHGTQLRGETCHLHKLTETEVREIRRLVGSASRASLAERFCVSPATITDITKRRSWAWLA